MDIFNNCNSLTNGEYKLLMSFLPNLVMFDIGCRSDSEFQKYKGEVHYFEPVKTFLDDLSSRKSLNTKSFYNNFGLSDTEVELSYYPRYQSFHNRVVSCKIDDSANSILLNCIRAKKYIEDNDIKKIDFVKIDTEGHEFNVIKGFEDKINIVSAIQFEYGGTYLDTDIKLNDVISYLKENGFTQFFYITPHELLTITDFRDHYQYCNIFCLR
jgi:FkbM family methyltransferase